MWCSDRRSRHLIANFIEEPQHDSPPSPRSDPEARIIPVDLDGTLSDGASTVSSSHSSSGFVDNLRWDEDDMMTPTGNLNSHQWNTPIITPTRLPALYVPQERTPLIRKANSFHIPTTKKGGYGSIEVKKKSKIRTSPPRKILPLEPTQKIQETVSLKRHPVGRSTFGQTVSAKGAL